MRPTRAGIRPYLFNGNLDLSSGHISVVRRRSHRSVRLIERNRELELRQYARHASGPHRHEAPDDAGPQCLTQRAGTAPLHAEGDGLSGVTSDGELLAFISARASCVGGVPVTRPMNPWPMPEASL